MFLEFKISISNVKLNTSYIQFSNLSRFKDIVFDFVGPSIPTTTPYLIVIAPGCNLGVNYQTFYHLISPIEMEVLPICDLLKAEPLAVQITLALQDFAPTSNVEELAVISALLKYTIPDVYRQLPEATRDVIADVFRSTVGLGNLIGRIDMIAGLRADVLGDLVDLLNIHTELLEKVLRPGMVFRASKNALAVRELDKLLYKGKCFSIIREVDMKFHNVYVAPVLASMAAYGTYLAQELLPMYSHVEVSTINIYILSLMSTSSQLPIFECFFNRHDSIHLRTSVAKMKRFERKQLLVRFLDWVCLRYFKSAFELDTIAAIYILAGEYLDALVCDQLTCETVISRYSYALNHTLSLLLRTSLTDDVYRALVLTLLTAWGNVGLLEEEPIVRQEFRTHLLLCMCYQLSSHSIQDLMKDTKFVSAISNRLLSLSNRVKSLGIYFADTLSDYSRTDKIFNMSSDVMEVLLPNTRISTSDVMFDVEEAWEILETPEIIEHHSEEIQDIGRQLAPVTLKDSEDLNMDEEEDDPSLASKPVHAPIYIRDLLAYLSVDSKSHGAYEKQRIALKTSPTLLRQKLKFGSEVSFFAEELLTILTALTNQYEENDFENLKLNAMIAVVVSCPSVTTHACQLLLTGDYSLQQRMCLLSCLSLAARELKGYEDEAVLQSFDPKSFPSKTLPPALHNQYISMAESDYGYARIENSIQNQLMDEVSEEAKDEISGGKILRMSSTLRKYVEPLAISKEQLTHFNKIVGKIFFFPILAVWYESLGIDIGPHTPILAAHFLRTLSIILHTAYPAAVDLNDMAREYLNLVMPILQTISMRELQVIESIVTGVTLVCELLDSTFLVVNFEGQLTIIEHTIGSWWESLIDERVKSLCAGLLLRISRLKTSMERTLMDQMNGFV